MEIYIELLIIAIVGIEVLVWFLWDTWSMKKIKKKYDPNENKSKKPGNFSQFDIGAGKPAVESPVESIVGLPEPEGRELLPTPVVGPVRENSRGIRKLLSRRRRKS